MSKIGDALKKFLGEPKADIASRTKTNPIDTNAPEEAATDGAVTAAKATTNLAVKEAVKDVMVDSQGTLKEAIQNVAKEVELVQQAEAISSDQQKSDLPKARPHAFVVMPFGQKEGLDGQIIDFNAIYRDLIAPALEDAGFEPFRADEETVSGDILTDMFQELLLADLVIADMSIDNGNVFYELGVRHAFRKRGIVHIQSGRAYMPFDIFNVRTIPYHTGDDGKPDPEFLEKDIQSISRVCRDTWASDQETIHSPIFNLLTGLTEPDRKALRTPLATGFWREYNEWKERVTVAQRQKRIGDVMLLTEEISNPLIKEEAIGEAGRALRGMGRHELALEQYRQGIELNSTNMEFRRQEAFHLNRLGRVDEAIVKLENLLEDNPNDTEAISYLGRVYKDMWAESWENIEAEDKRHQEAFDASHWLVKSFHTYLKGFYYDLNEYYPGTNALTLAIILDHLVEQYDEGDDPDVQAIRDILPNLKGTLEFSLENLTQDDASDYWTLASLAELKVMTAENPNEAKRAYRKALTAARKNVFYLQSSIDQLNMLKSLSLRLDYVDAGVQVLKDEIRRIRKDAPEDETSEEKTDRGRVYLFTGHKIDMNDKGLRRFPPEMEKEARKRIDAALEKYNTDDDDLAVTAGAACGGDIIFIEACLERGMSVDVHLPFSEPLYIKNNVSFAGDQWVERFYNLRNHNNVNIRFQFDHIGKVKSDDDIYKRNNRWAIYSSLIQGIDRVRLIALWDGKVAATDRDGLLVSHMVEEMRRLGGYVKHLNTTKFDYWQAGGKVGAALDKLAGL
ncbi:MAG: TRAFs-binding domain-containing protein [Chloroflexota bacterium]|nr:TRAFs-binding domain-containing protein [Chloroflexota bacterium]